MAEPEYTTKRDIVCWTHGLMLGAAIGLPAGLVLSWLI